ncbi:uncharacterized protein LOC128387958 [Panonychus citri]|uniref:uncharacterized protein LOC128387958 n=1 Tax=Panonychus citri TaxID=50023 RepID=UPI00230829D5|nr:uncharacterized protein LOC128387958 [Panonychus citri]
MVKPTTGSNYGGDKMSKPTEVKPEQSIEKISAKVAGIKSREYPNFPQSYSGGNMPMSIQSKFQWERQRLSEDFNQKWRNWRAQWIKDQTLHPAEPLHVKALEHEFYNPIRRAMRVPLNLFELQVAKITGPARANIIRRCTAVGIATYVTGLWLYYLFKYRQRTWEDSSRSGWPMIWTARERVLPGDPAYPNVGIKFEKQEFADLGFSSRKVLLFKEPNTN